jgi:hypothetical protein
MTEKRQTSQGYIIHILQHFATKLWNITNFVMLFQAVMKFSSRSKFSLYSNANGPFCHVVFQTNAQGFMGLRQRLGIGEIWICFFCQIRLFLANRSTVFGLFSPFFVEKIIFELCKRLFLNM